MARPCSSNSPSSRNVVILGNKRGAAPPDPGPRAALAGVTDAPASGNKLKRKFFKMAAEQRIFLRVVANSFARYVVNVFEKCEWIE